MAPSSADRTRQINWPYTSWLLAIHVVALLALVPWFFSWAGVVSFFVYYLFGMLGITVCLHRLLTHRSFACPLWLERTLSVLAAGTVQDSPAYWVSIHRRHHNFSDRERDPHSPELGLFWAHVGWLLVRPADMQSGRMIARYAEGRDARSVPGLDGAQRQLVQAGRWRHGRRSTWLGLAGGLMAGKSLMECRAARPEHSGLGRRAADRPAGTSPGRSIRSRIAGAIAITRPPTTAATTR